MGFDSKRDFIPPTILLGLLLCPWMLLSFFGGIEHSPVNVVQQHVVILEFLQEKMSRCPSTRPSCMNRQEDRTLKDELPRSGGAQYATGDQWRNNSRKMKRQNQSKHNIQLWMCLVMEVKSDAIKSNTA